MSRTKRILVRLLLLSATGLILFVVLEVAARLYVTRFASEERFLKYASLAQLQDRYGGALLTPHRYLGFIPTPNYVRDANRHNALGYRGDEIAVPKPKGEFRIACLGGSTTYTYDVKDYRGSYPCLLQKQLVAQGYSHVSVINAGVPGWGSWESLIDFEFRTLDLEPDLIVVYHAMNDVHPRLVWPPETYRGDNSGYRAPNNANSPGIWEESTLIRGFLVRSGRRMSHSTTRFVDASAPSFLGDDFIHQKLEGGYPRGALAEAPVAEMLKRNRPDYFRRNLESLIAVARRHRVQVVLMTFINLPMTPGEMIEHIGRNCPIGSSPDYWKALDEMNEVVREVARQDAVPLQDLARVFPKEKRYFTDGHHVNAEGAKLEAELCARFLVETQLISVGQRQSEHRQSAR